MQHWTTGLIALIDSLPFIELVKLRPEDMKFGSPTSEFELFLDKITPVYYYLNLLNSLPLALRIVILLMAGSETTKYPLASMATENG